MKQQIKEYMTPLPNTVGSDVSLDKAEQMMRECKCRHLPVLQGGKLVGVLSERDIQLLRVFEKQNEVAVRDVMTEEPFVVDPEAPLKDVAAQMVERRIGSAIIRAKGDTPWGIFTTTDALKVLMRNL